MSVTPQKYAAGLPVLIRRNFNARHRNLGFPSDDTRGKALTEAINFNELEVVNAPATPTRVGLHRKQTDTSADLGITTAVIIRQRETHRTT